MLAVAGLTLASTCCAESDGGSVIACANYPAMSGESSQGKLLLFAEHEQVMIIEGTVQADFQPTVSISQSESGTTVTITRTERGRPKTHTARLPPDLPGRISAALPLLQAEARTESDDQVGWRVQSQSGMCVFVVHDMFSALLGAPPRHWMVALLNGLISYGDARTRRARQEAEAAIRAALGSTGA